MDSILNTTKKLLGIMPEYEHFDADIVMHLSKYSGGKIEKSVFTFTQGLYFLRWLMSRFHKFWGFFTALKVVPFSSKLRRKRFISRLK